MWQTVINIFDILLGSKNIIISYIKLFYLKKIHKLIEILKFIEIIIKSIDYG
jgi:hypothetical protein